MNKIYLSSPAVLSCAGGTLNELWTSLILGKQDGIKRVKVYDKEFYSGIIEEERLKVLPSPPYDSRIYSIERECIQGLTSSVNKLLSLYDRKKIGVCVGCCDNGSFASFKAHEAYFREGKFNSAYKIEEQGAALAASFISSFFNLTGPSCTFSLSCSSGAAAIVKGAALILSGACEAMIVGGVDIASDIVLLGFDSLGAVSKTLTNPFSKNRGGITLGEGAAFFILTKTPLEIEGKKKEGASVILEGFGSSCDAYHATSPSPTGEGAVRAMKKAIKQAGVLPEEVDYVNAHGTGTRLNDAMESYAMKEVFGKRQPYFSSTKSITCHTLGAAGALEAVICYLTLTKNYGKKSVTLPIQVWDKERDLTLPLLNIVSESKVGEGEIRHCMSNTYGFGGVNISLIFGIDGGD